MKVLLSTIGSRGDVQPVVALALELKRLRQEVRLCVPPDFCPWIEGLGLSATPIGPELKSTGKSAPMNTRVTPEQIRAKLEDTVTAQFATVSRAAEGCDVMVGATALQIAAPSIAESMGIPYVFAAYAPNVVPSRHHAPPLLPALGDKLAPDLEDHRELWSRDAQRWNLQWQELLNVNRTRLGLAPVANVHRHILTHKPWLAADPILGPWPDHADAIFQTGAWVLPDAAPLAPELEAFLRAGDPPVYVGFGSIRTPTDFNRVAIESVRAVGRRVIVFQGWAEMTLLDDGPDCLLVGDVNHQALFQRVAAVVHHGGAGTTGAAARAGAPQVVIPQHYDQPYWAGRVEKLGIGKAHALGAATTESLTHALASALKPEVAARATATAALLNTDGARLAAESLLNLVSG